MVKISPLDYKIKNSRLNPDTGLIDVDGDVDLYNKDLKTVPFNFGVVQGEFNIGCNQLTSLKGSPTHVGDTFKCSNNELTSLEYSPKPVNQKIKLFDASFNKITSLKGVPQDVVNLHMAQNKLKNLDYVPKILGILSCSFNPEFELREADELTITDQLSLIDTKVSLFPEGIKVSNIFYIIFKNPITSKVEEFEVKDFNKILSVVKNKKLVKETIQGISR